MTAKSVPAWSVLAQREARGPSGMRSVCLKMVAQPLVAIPLPLNDRRDPANSSAQPLAKIRQGGMKSRLGGAS